MEHLLARARSYLDALEAERQTALTLSKQKAQEAELIKARQEGFQAAIDMVGSEIAAAGNAGTDRQPKEPVRRRGRRPIRDMILHELSFSGQAMTTAQIAQAINYLPERTQVALQRMEADGQVLRNHGRWAVGTTSLNHMNGHAVSAGNSEAQEPPDAQRAPNNDGIGILTSVPSKSNI